MQTQQPKKETVRGALEEFIKTKERQRLKEMAGSGILDMSLRQLKSISKKREKKAPEPDPVTNTIVLIDTGTWICFFARREYNELKQSLSALLD